ncbi:unnamed protein product [Symbiodinium natans]|uniref:Uncharacterized protein n=1 Tax=Symbiodinium natans TaxID=878477 RepID=A0A812KHN5_9DINO|nr:unnamed protein product [Symbiodinium natans]
MTFVRPPSGYASPAFAGSAGFSSPGFGSPPMLRPTVRGDRASRGSLHSAPSTLGVPSASAPLGASYSLTSLVSSDSGPGARAPPRTAGSVLGQGQVLQAPQAFQPPHPAPQIQLPVQIAQPLIAPQVPQAEQVLVPPLDAGHPQKAHPVPLFGRTMRSSPGSSTTSLHSAPREPVIPAPVANVAKPMWVIEEVIDFGVEEREEDPDQDDFGRVCQSRFFPESLLEGCMLWNCSEEDEFRRHREAEQ